MSTSLLQKSKTLTKRIQRRNKKIREVDQFHWHEILHVSCIIAEMFDKYIVEHTATKSDKYLRLKTEKLMTELLDLYGDISKRIDFLDIGDVNEEK